MPTAIPDPAGLAVFGEDQPLLRFLSVRQNGIDVLADAMSKEDRFRGLLMVTNASKHALDRITAAMPQLRDLSVYDPAREAAVAWGKQAIDAVQDTIDLADEQTALADELGSEVSEGILSDVRENFSTRKPVADVDPGPYEVALLPEPRGVLVYGDDQDFVELVAARNLAPPLMSESDPETRLAGLLLLTNLSEHILQGLTEKLPRLAALPESTPGREEAVEYARTLTAAMQLWPPYVDEQKALSHHLGPEASERAIARATALMRGDTDTASTEAPVSTADTPEPAASTTDTKVCPDCAEEIKAAAKVCRFCGYRFADAP